MKVSESIRNFLQARKTANNADLIDRWSIEMETQVLVIQGSGEPVAGKQGTYTDGINTWAPLRIPHKANSGPEWTDYNISWPLDEHYEGIGMTGWKWTTKESLWVGFDVDSLVGHADGITEEELGKVKEAANALPYVEVRRSTGGVGCHLYVYLDNIPTQNHTEHAALARVVLARMSADSGFDLSAKVDCLGGVMWILHRKLAPNGLEIIKPAIKTLSETDLPTNWRTPPKKTHKNTDRRALEKQLIELGWTVSGDTAKHPDTDKAVSASFLVADDGTDLFRVHSSSTKFEKDRTYNCRDALRVIAPTRFQPISSRELAETDCRVTYAVDNTLVEGEPCLLIGEKKGMKSTTAIALAIALASGKPFLGHFGVSRPRRVFLMNGESGKPTLKETALRICRSHGLSLEDLDNLFFQTNLPSLDNPTDLEDIEAVLQAMKCEVWFVDCAYLCLPGSDAGNLFIQGERLRRVSEMCRRNGITWILCHHVKKKKKTDEVQDFDLDNMSWSGFAEFARQWISLARREKYISGTGRHEMLMDVGGSAGHGGQYAVDIEEGPAGEPRKWEVTVSTPTEAREEKKEAKLQEYATKARAAILDYLGQHPDGETSSHICGAQGLNYRRSLIVFGTLEGEELIVRCKIKKSHQHFNGFKLKGSQQ